MTPLGGCLVVGMGALARGDDAVGPAVAAAVAAEVDRRGWRHVRVMDQADPHELLDLLARGGSGGWARVVLVDAVRAGAPGPGTQRPIDRPGPRSGEVVVLETGPDRPPLPARVGSRASTHGFGVADAVELARALHRLPARLLLVGVVASGFEPGSELTAEVAAARDAAVARVLGLVDPDGVGADVPQN